MATIPSDTPDTVAQALTRHQSRLYAYVFAAVADPQTAHDVFQETNRVLWEQAAEFDPERPFLPWALAVARNQVRAARQRRRRDRLTFDADVEERVIAALEVRAESHDARQVALAGCLQRLDRRQRELIEHRYSEDRSLADIARDRGQSARTIAVTMHRVRRTLAECIKRALGAGAFA